jgi:hypothetical protein
VLTSESPDRASPVRSSPQSPSPPLPAVRTLSVRTPTCKIKRGSTAHMNQHTIHLVPIRVDGTDLDITSPSVQVQMDVHDFSVIRE